jgi:serine/threonine-protein kinase
VPDVVGLSKADARTMLTTAGFKVKEVDQPQSASSTTTPGTVLRQSPAANTKAVKGSSVTIFVAKAPPSTGGAGPGSTTTTPTTPTPSPGAGGTP